MVFLNPPDVARLLRLDVVWAQGGQLCADAHLRVDAVRVKAKHAEPEVCMAYTVRFLHNKCHTVGCPQLASIKQRVLYLPKRLVQSNVKLSSPLVLSFG